MTTPVPKVNEYKSFLLLILAVGAIAGGAAIAIRRHPAPPAIAATEPVISTPPRAAPPRPTASITRSVDGAIVRAGPAVASISRVGSPGDVRFFARRYVDWEDRRIAMSVARALAEPNFATALALTPQQLTELRRLNLKMSPEYTQAQTLAIIKAYRAWENANDAARPEAQKNLLAAVADAGETLEARPEFSAQITQVRTLVSQTQWEQLRFPSRVESPPATASRPATIPK